MDIIKKTFASFMLGITIVNVIESLCLGIPGCYKIV